MKLAVSIVFYNPEKDAVERALSLADSFDHVYVIDNSPFPLTDFPPEKLESKITYRCFGENQGIATALNLALKKAKEDGYDFLLTLDEDSIYPIQNHEDIRKTLENLPQDIAVFCLAHEGEKIEEPAVMKDVAYPITSGCFLRLSFFREKGVGFMDELFIDMVDFEFDRQVLLNGGRIVWDSHFLLGHKVGNPVAKKILGVRVRSTNHSPLRLYYRFRNIHYLYKIDKKYYRPLYKRANGIEYWKMLLVESNLKEKKRFIKLGKRHAKAKILGPYKEGN